MLGILGGLSNIFSLLKIGAVLGPLMYIFYTVNDYRGQSVRLEANRHEIARLNKANVAWEARYARINIKRGDYQERLKNINSAIEASGCEQKILRTLKEIEDADTVKAFNEERTQGGQ
jgi:hypothetical protein